jgi:hypothetical protein
MWLRFTVCLEERSTFQRHLRMMKLGSNVVYVPVNVSSVKMNAVFVVSEPSAMVVSITSQGHPQGDCSTGTEIHFRQIA